MKLLTRKQFETLLDNGRRQAAVEGTPDEIDFKPVVKLFNPCGAATWLLTEIEPDDHAIAWGVCDLSMGFPEFGIVSLTELASVRGPARPRRRARPVVRGAQTDLGLSRGGEPERAYRRLSESFNDVADLHQPSNNRCVSRIEVDTARRKALCTTLRMEGLSCDSY